MVRWQSPARGQDCSFKDNTGYLDAAPMFYWVPCAGVKYYTFDSREALQQRIDRWAARERTAQDPAEAPAQ